MSCSRCHKDIPPTSMWYCYRNGQDYCNTCFGQLLEEDYKKFQQIIETLLTLDLNMIYDAIMARGNVNAGARWRELQELTKELK